MSSGGILTHYLFRFHQVQVIIIFVLGITFFSGVTCAVSQEVGFPPNNTIYSGDYVYITESGKYTLEQDLMHTYPVGVIISASSVVLDGQGYQVSPASPDGSTVGIWVSLLDSKGQPVSGVTIRNVSIKRERYGVYGEGTEAPDFSWAPDRRGDPLARDAVKFPRNLSLNAVSVSGCKDGIVLHSLSGFSLDSCVIAENTGSGLRLSGMFAHIRDTLIHNNNGYGIDLNGESESEITGDTLRNNRNGGIRCVGTDLVTIFNNVLDNEQNIVVSGQNTRLVLNTTRQNGSNINGGPVIGGNLWEKGGDQIYSRVVDADHDMILDDPYSPGVGVSDMLPLITKSPEVLPVLVTVSVSPTNVPVTVATQRPTVTSGLHAVIINDTIPEVLESGKRYDVALTMYNDGTDDWLSSPQIGVKAAGELENNLPAWQAVPGSGKMGTGESYTFHFQITSPKSTGPHTYQFQAAREGNGIEILFGRPYSKTVTVR